LTNHVAAPHVQAQQAQIQVAAGHVRHALPRVRPGGQVPVRAKPLWGTDFPHPNATHEADEAELVDLIPQFAPAAVEQQRLLVDNPAQLYGFSA
jgi:Amidohydrolase